MSQNVNVDERSLDLQSKIAHQQSENRNLLKH